MAKKTPVQFAEQIRGAKGRFAAGNPAIEAKAQSLFSADVDSNFQGSHTPGGQAWPPIHHRTGKPLILTGKLWRAAVRAAKKAKIIGGKIVAKLASSAVRYGQFQDQGTKTIKQRKFFAPARKTVKALAKFTAKQAAKAFRGK